MGPIKFNILEISPDGKTLTIDAEIIDNEANKNVFIKSLYINSKNNFLEKGVNTEKYSYYKSLATEEIIPSSTKRYLDLHNYENSQLGDSVLATLSEDDYWNGTTNSMGIIRGNLNSDDKTCYRSLYSYDINSVLPFRTDNNSESILSYEADSSTSSGITLVFKESNVIISQELYNLYMSHAYKIAGTIREEIIPESSSTYYDKKRIQLTINSESLLDLSNFNESLFYVYVETVDSEDLELKKYSLGVTFNTYNIYNKSLNFVKELGINCIIPRNFIDFILQFEALKASVESNHYVEANKIFSRLYKTFGVIDSANSPTYNNCNYYGCNII